jgi:hypothetical protein
VDGVTAQERIVFFDLQLFGLELFVARRGITGRRLAFLARFGALDRNNLSRHKLFLLLGRLFFDFVVFVADVDRAGAVHGAELLFSMRLSASSIS